MVVKNFRADAVRINAAAGGLVTHCVGESFGDHTNHFCDIPRELINHHNRSKFRKEMFESDKRFLNCVGGKFFLLGEQGGLTAQDIA